MFKRSEKSEFGHGGNTVDLTTRDRRAEGITQVQPTPWGPAN